MPQSRLNCLQGVLGLLLLLIDALSKLWIYTSVDRDIPVFDKFLGGIDFSISPVANHGAAWGIFSDHQILLLLFRFAAILALGYYVWLLKDNNLKKFALLLIFFGAIGNIVDYFIYGYVLDMFFFTFWGYPFAIFNIADSAISVGVITFLLLSLGTSPIGDTIKTRTPR